MNESTSAVPEKPRGKWRRRMAAMAVVAAIYFAGMFSLTLAVGCAGLKIEDADTSTAAAMPAELPGELRIEKDIVFATPQGFAPLKLDLYLPPSGVAGPIPAIIGLHGGGFVEGNKGQYEDFAKALAKRGIAVAAPNYRLYSDAVMPACIEDAKAAVRWVRANAEKYNLDPARIGAMGRSAGGYLALMLGTTAGDESLEGDGGNAGVDSSVSLVISEAGPTDFDPYLWDGSLRGAGLKNFIGEIDPRRISPARRIDDHTPPTLLFHGGRDGTIHYSQSRIFEAVMIAKSRPVRLVSFGGTDHDPLFWHWDRGQREIWQFIGEHWPGVAPQTAASMPN